MSTDTLVCAGGAFSSQPLRMTSLTIVEDRELRFVDDLVRSADEDLAEVVALFE